jgi:hypothetical protein
MKNELGRIYNSSFYYCKFTLDNLNNAIENEVDIERLKLYESKVYELPHTIRKVPLYNMEFLIGSIDSELNKAIEKLSKGNDATEEIKLVSQLIKITNEAYDMVINECRDNDFLWYKYLNDKKFTDRVNKIITDNYNKLYME